MDARWGPAAALLVVLAAHLPIFRAGYVQDDHLAIENNPVVDRASITEIVSSSYWKGAEGDDRTVYRPVVIATYALESVLGGPSPAASHAINVVLHLLTALALFALARRLALGLWPAAVAAVLFGVHPAKSEAVLNVVGRAEVLAALFGLGALLAFTYAGPWPGDEGPPSDRRARLAAWGTGALVLLGAASKETAAVVPALLILLELSYRPIPRGRMIVRRAAALAPTALGIVLFAVLRTRALEAVLPLPQVPAFDNPLVALPPDVRAATAFALAARYGLLLIAPVRLANDWSGPSLAAETSFWAWRPLAGIGLLAMLVVVGTAPAAARLIGRPFDAVGRVLAFAAALVLLPYLVVGNLVFTIGVVYAERLLYFPTAGFCLGIGALLGRVTRSRAARGAIVVVLALFAARTFVRATDWLDDPTIFRATVRANPSSPRAWFALAKMRTDALGEPIRDRAASAEALELYERTLDLWPEQPNAWHEKGLLLARLGDLAAAEAALREAVRLNPRHADAWLNLGLTLQRLGRTPEAIRTWRKATIFDPSLHRAWASLGHVAFENGRWDEASAAYARAVALGRSDLDARWRDARHRATAGPGR